MKNIQTIIKKELKSYFVSPTVYIAVIVFLLLWEFLFFKNVFLAGEVSLRSLFDLLPWFFLILIPAITMSSISSENSQNTLEWILTKRISDLTFVLGKFISSFLLALFCLLLTLAIAISFSYFGSLDWGIYLAQMLGAVLLAALFVSIGIFCSAFFASSIASMLVSCASIFALIIVGLDFVTSSTPFVVAKILEQISALTHFQSIIRGVVDFKDVLYFVSGTALFLSLSYLRLLQRRIGNRFWIFLKYQILTLSFIALTICVNFFSYGLPGRIDLTSSKQYSLSQTTKTTLGELKEPITITLFASSQLPSQFQPILRDVRDLLRDYESYGKNKIVLSFKNPSDPQAKQDADKLGVREIQFNVVSQEEFQIKTGYLGLAITFGQSHESLPFIQSTSDLEYQLTSFIKKLTNTQKKKIVFLIGDEQKNLYTDLNLLNRELQKLFVIEPSTLKEDDQAIATDAAVIAIVGSTKANDPKTIDTLKKLMLEGKNIFVAVDKVEIEQTIMNGRETGENISEIFKEYGISLNNGVVYDLRSNKTVRFGSESVSYFLPYPFWVQALKANNISSSVSNIGNLVLPWSGAINFDNNLAKDKKAVAEILFTTSQFAGEQTGTINVSPQFQLPTDNLSTKTLGLLLKTDKNRNVIFANSTFLTDQFVSNAPENLGFAIDALSFLAAEKPLGEIRAKQNMNKQFVFSTRADPEYIKYGNLIFALTLPVIFGLYQWLIRYRLKQKVYTPGQ